MTSTTRVVRSIAQEDTTFAHDARCKKSGKTSSSSSSLSLFREWLNRRSGGARANATNEKRRAPPIDDDDALFPHVLVECSRAFVSFWRYVCTHGKRERSINVSGHACVCTINTTKKQDEQVLFLSLSLSLFLIKWAPIRERCDRDRSLLPSSSFSSLSS